MSEITRTSSPADSGDPLASIPVKCLLVDDRDENLLALGALLREPHVEVLTATSGAAALELLLEHEFALALVDVQMPEMDGFELAELMRGSERTRQVPIIFVTAAGVDQSRVFKGYDTGAVDFLYKPVEPRVIRHKAGVFFELYRQRQRLARELHERTETLKLNEMFTAVLGHDLRNPLSAILAGAQMLQVASTDDHVRRTATRITSSAVRMTRLIEDLLDMARARLAGGIPLRLERIDLEVLVRRSVQEHEPSAADSRFLVSSAGDTVGVWDETRLTQVLSNLLGNAITHKRGTSDVVVDVDGSNTETVQFSISNAGEIPADSLPSVFSPFRRAGNDTVTEGLGLGLYIVQQIVHAHGGVVSVSSARQTTTFSVRLPRHTQAP